MPGGGFSERMHPGRRVRRTAVMAAGSAPRGARRAMRFFRAVSKAFFVGASSRMRAWMDFPPEVYMAAMGSCS